MSQELKQLRQQLRAERCPEAVLGRVRAEISRQRRTPSLGYSLGWATAAVLFLGVISVPLVPWSRQQPTASTGIHPLTGALEENRAIRKQAHLALAVFGHALKHAGDQSRDTILEVSLPHLRQGLRTAGAAISRQRQSDNTNQEIKP